MNLSALQAALIGSIGANDDVQEPTHFLDTGIPHLNLILSGRYDGGVPYGRIVEMFGPASSGKTAIATQLMIAAQKAGGIAMFSDHERSFVQKLAVGMGLDPTPGPWVYKRHKTWEEANTEAMQLAEVVRSKKLIAPEAPIICVFDSVAAMIPQSVFEKGINQYSMNDTTALARVSSTTLKAINQLTADLNVIMLYLNQIRTKPGVMYGDPTSTPGGVAFEFYSTIRLALGRSLEKDKDKSVTGQTISVLTKKNKVNRPFQKIELKLEFPKEGGAFFNVTESLVEHLIQVGALTTSGAYVNWVDGKKYHKGPLIEGLIKAGDEGRKALMALLPKPDAVDLTETDHEAKTGAAEADGAAVAAAAA